MKNYRALIPVGMLVVMLASWYLLVQNVTETERTYNNYLGQARKYAEEGITKYAMQNYNAALEMNSTPELYIEIIQYYNEQGDASEYLLWCRKFFDAYPTNIGAYEYLLGVYLENKDYKMCFDILETARKRSITSDYIEQAEADIQYVYTFAYNNFSDVAVYSNSYCPVKGSGLWGFADRYGNQVISCVYKEVGSFTQSGVAPVVDSTGDAYFIDNTGAKVMASKEKYQSFGALVDGKIAAKRMDNKYTYVDQGFNVLFGEYDYASTMNSGVAAVRTGDSWQLIGADGKELTAEKYVDIKVDEKQIAYRNDRCFAATSDGNYIMLDGSGTQVGTLSFEDARVFAGDAPAAVKLQGKWCFVNQEGSLISNEKYDDARSFANGLAAVCINGKWGFVDLEETVVIEPQFFETKDFNEKGSCYVNVGDSWQLLKLYRLNR